MTPSGVSFVIPMYNERRTIEDTARKVISIAKDIFPDYEIVISDDGSTDGSYLAAEKIAYENSRVKVLRLEKNTKFGGALKEGLKHARKEVVIYTDADLPIDANNIREALELLDDADIVNAYSKIKKGETAGRVVMSKVYNVLIQFLFKTSIRDINSGFKIYKRKVLDGMNLISRSPFVDVEIFVRAKRKGFKVAQYPIIFKHRLQGKSYISRPAVVLRTLYDMLRFKCQRSSL